MSGALHLSVDVTVKPSSQMTIAGNGGLFIQVVENVHQRICLRNLDDRAVRKNLSDCMLKNRPIPLPVEVVDQHESAPNQVLPQVGSLQRRRIPVAHANGLKKQERVLKD